MVGCTADEHAVGVVLTPTPQPDYEITEADFAAMHSALQRRSRAVEEGDKQAFLSTVDRRQKELYERQSTLFDNFAALPDVHLRYTMSNYDQGSVDIPGVEPECQPGITAHVLISGTTRRPIADPLTYTFVKHDGKWLIASDEGDPGQSVTPPWIGGPIAVADGRHMLVVTDESDAQDGERILQMASAALRRDARYFHQPLGGQLLVDATSHWRVGATSVHGMEAAAVTFPYAAMSDAHGKRIAGWGIKVNPLALPALLDKPTLMRHELAHFVLRTVDANNPTWLVEGVAEFAGYQPTPFSSQQVPDDVYAAVQEMPRKLPQTGRFYAHPQRNYLLGRAAVAYLVRHGGVDTLLELMRSYGQYPNDVPDQWTDRLLHRLYGFGTERLVRGAVSLIGKMQH